jgi:HemY protein
MMARVEEADHGDLLHAREWLDRAVRALPDPRYVCTACGGESTKWQSLCPRCGAFDTLAWRTPAWNAAIPALPAAVEEVPPVELIAASPTPALPASAPEAG